LLRLGSKIAAKMAMMAITTSSSIRVNAVLLFRPECQVGGGPLKAVAFILGSN